MGGGNLSWGLGICPYATHLQKRWKRPTLTGVIPRYLSSQHSQNSLKVLWKHVFLNSQNSMTPLPPLSRGHESLAKPMTPSTRLLPPYKSDRNMDSPAIAVLSTLLLPTTGHCVKIHVFWLGVSHKYKKFSNQKSKISGWYDEFESSLKLFEIWWVLAIKNCANWQCTKIIPYTCMKKIRSAGAGGAGAWGGDDGWPGGCGVFGSAGEGKVDSLAAGFL